jgi:hypothetical protein
MSYGRQQDDSCAAHVSGGTPSRRLMLALPRRQMILMRIERFIPNGAEVRPIHVNRGAAIPDAEDIGSLERSTFPVVENIVVVGVRGVLK